MAFKHESLTSDRQFRLLKLNPVALFSDQLHCHIQHTCLDDDVDYEALSYTWGEPELESSLYCDGALLQIRPNLDSALRHLRSGDANRRLWIDAVCINQVDAAERSMQVPLMRDIYTKATQVVAWIGEEHPTDTLAMDVDKSSTLPESPEGKDMVFNVFTSFGQMM